MAVNQEIARPSLRGMLGQSATYVAGSLAYKAVAVVSVPIFARLLRPADLGLLDLAAVSAGVFSIAALLGTETALARFVPGDRQAARLWSSAVVLVTIAVVVGLAGVTLSSQALATLLTGSPDRSTTVIAAGIYGAALVGVTTSLNVLRIEGLAGRYALCGFIIVTGEMLAAVALAASGAPVAMIVLGWAAASCIGALVVILVWRPPLGRPDLSRARRLLRFGLPLVPAAIAWVAGDLAVRAVIASGNDLALLGQYGIASRVTSVLILVVTGFTLAWHPFLYRTPSASVTETASRALVQLTVALGFIAIALSALAPELVEIVAGPAYRPGAQAVPVLSVGLVAFGWLALSSAIFGVTLQTRSVATACLAGMAVQILVAIAAIPMLGIAGAALASSAGYMVAAGLCLISLPQVGDHSPTSLRWLASGAIAIAALALMWLLQNEGLGVRAAAGCIGLIGLAAVGWRSAVASWRDVC